MNWKILLLAFVIVSSGCISQANSDLEENNSGDNPTEAQESQLTEKETNQTTIYFTSNGFSPSAITVEQGTTVTWINNRSTSMWIGSDRHPTHTEYSGTSLAEHCSSGDQTSAAFDQCSTGDRFSFTFEKEGEWSYHNHEPFVRGGTVTVK